MGFLFKLVVATGILMLRAVGLIHAGVGWCLAFAWVRERKTKADPPLSHPTDEDLSAGTLVCSG
jgi:hypothetical protein